MAAESSPAADGLSPPGLAIRFYQRYLSDLRHGRCRFEPSCSQYAADAITHRGVLVGSALAADRLIRCNRTARELHARGPDGRLIDPAVGHAMPRWRPRVPDWLLPPVPGFPPGGEEATSSESDAGRSPARLRDLAEFAEWLEEEGDCWRATTEYMRVAFLVQTPRLAYWARMRAGWCRFRFEEWDAAADGFLTAALDANTSTEQEGAAFMAAAASFNAARHDQCRDILSEWGPDSLDRRTTRQDWLLLGGINSMTMGEWTLAATRLQEAVRLQEALALHTEPARLQKIRYLEQRVTEGYHLPRRRPTLAAMLSAVLPGSGQLYVGRFNDGFRHFLFDGLLIYWVYHLARNEDYVGAYLVTGVTLPFYLGNILGAKRSAERYNAAKTARFTARVLAATDG